jgi:L-fucose isomerase-like protein
MPYNGRKAPRIAIVANSIGVFSAEGKETVESQMRNLLDSLKKENWVAADSIFWPERIFGPVEAAHVAEQLGKERLDALVLLNSAFTNGTTFLTFATDPYLSQLPLVVTAPPEFQTPTPEWSTNAYCALIMNNFTAKKLGRPLFTLGGWPRNEEFQKRFQEFLRVIFTIKELRKLFIGKIGEAPGGFHPTMGDVLGYAKMFGVRVETLDWTGVLDTVKTGKAKGFAGEATFSEADVEATCGEMMENVEVLINKDQMKRTARLFHALKATMEANGFNAAAMRCWPEIGNPAIYGTAICFIMGHLMATGVLSAAACEGDWPMAVAQTIGACLTGRPTLCLDFVNCVADKPVVQLGHCGAGIPSLMPNAQLTDISPDRQAGNSVTPACVGQFEYGVKTGFSLMGDGAGKFKMLAFTGESREDTAQGIHYAAADVYVSDPVKLNNLILEHGFGHHLAVAFGDISRELKLFCQFHGIEYIHLSES